MRKIRIDTLIFLYRFAVTFCMGVWSVRYLNTVVKFIKMGYILYSCMECKMAVVAMSEREKSCLFQLK